MLFYTIFYVCLYICIVQLSLNLQHSDQLQERESLKYILSVSLWSLLLIFLLIVPILVYKATVAHWLLGFVGLGIAFFHLDRHYLCYGNNPWRFRYADVVSAATRGVVFALCLFGGRDIDEEKLNIALGSIPPHQNPNLSGKVNEKV